MSDDDAIFPIILIAAIFVFGAHSVPDYLSEMILKERNPNYNVSVDKVFSYYIQETENQYRLHSGYRAPSLCGRFIFKNKVTDKSNIKYYIVNFEKIEKTLEIAEDQAAMCLKFGDENNTPYISGIGTGIETFSVFKSKIFNR